MLKSSKRKLSKVRPQVNWKAIKNINNNSNSYYFVSDDNVPGTMLSNPSDTDIIIPTLKIRKLGENLTN